MRLSAEDRKEMDDLTAEVRALKVELRKARQERDDAVALRKAEDELSTIKKEVERQLIKQDRLKEDHERERREIEHKVGLEKKRQEMELKLAKREAIVEVQEQNLDADRKRFEDQMKFTTDRFEAEAQSMHSLMQAILKRLPTVTEHIDMSIANGKTTAKT